MREPLQVGSMRELAVDFNVSSVAEGLCRCLTSLDISVFHSKDQGRSCCIAEGLGKVTKGTSFSVDIEDMVCRQPKKVQSLKMLKSLQVLPLGVALKGGVEHGSVGMPFREDWQGYHGGCGRVAKVVCPRV